MLDRALHRSRTRLHSISRQHTTALNLGAHMYAREKLADDCDRTIKCEQISVTKSETFQFGGMQFNDLCQEKYWTAAGLGCKASADTHTTAVNLGAHMYARKEFADASLITKCAQTSIKQQEQCGSCWSFAATRGTHEPWRHVGTKLLFSEQQPNDCFRTTFFFRTAKMMPVRMCARRMNQQNLLVCQQ